MQRIWNPIGRRGSALLLVGASAVTMAACNTTEAKEIVTTTEYGSTVKLGQGTARTYITSVNGEPQEVGVALSEAALNGLPTSHDPGGVLIEGHYMSFENILALPQNNPTGFAYVTLNWNPGGHEPPGLYESPHFDFHFYWLSNEERVAIDPSDPEFQKKTERVPAPEYIPQGYILPAPMAVPQMGVHWVDPTSPELNGQPFTQTFIYGSWDGEVIFAEPMITKAFLETKPNFTKALPAPKQIAADGWYPGSYSIRWDATAKEYRIALTGMVARKSSDGQ